MGLQMEDLANQVQHTQQAIYHLHALGWVSGRSHGPRARCLPSPVRAEARVMG